MKRGVVSLLIVASAYAAVDLRAQSGKESVAELVTKMKQGQVTLPAIARIVEAAPADAIPVFEQRFAQTTDMTTRQALASGLVRLGSREAAYWDLLATRARAAIEANVPFPVRFDASGRSVLGDPSPEFVAWARANGVSAEAASNTQMYGLPIDVTFLAVTGDARGLALLQRGLTSRNYLVQTASAKGLAKLGDRGSIPLIIDACRKAPSEVAALTAQALVFFDDDRARAASEEFIKDPVLLDGLRRLSREKGPSALF